MIDPRNISISSYTYDLPTGKIAAYPLAKRDGSKLLVYKDGRITDDVFKNAASHLPNDSLLIFNDTKVVNARLVFKNNIGKTIEIFSLAPAGNDNEEQTAFSRTGTVMWECMVGNLKAWKWQEENLELDFTVNGNKCKLYAKLIERLDDTFIISFSWQPPDLSFAEVLDKAGMVPLPPYIKRDAAESDKAAYQTVYAHYEGSVAAPTAGLHFTEDVLSSLKRKNIRSCYLTLHVGAGTFKPVKSALISGHSMHAEHFSVGKGVIEEIYDAIKSSKKIISVGTTSMRTIESLYWLGVQIIQKNAVNTNDVSVSQWEPYDSPSEVPAEDALKAILDYLNIRNSGHVHGSTSIIIVPGYKFRIFDGLITNFHQPGSTLLLLVAAFIGSPWKVVYEYALNNDFRFLSYGDSSILFK